MAKKLIVGLMKKLMTTKGDTSQIKNWINASSVLISDEKIIRGSIKCENKPSVSSRTIPLAYWFVPETKESGDFLIREVYSSNSDTLKVKVTNGDYFGDAHIGRLDSSSEHLRKIGLCRRHDGY